MNPLNYIKKNWDFKKSTQENVLRFSNEQEQARRKGDRLRKKLFPLFIILGVAISIFTQNPLIALVLFIGTIRWGSEYVFNQARTSCISVSALDSTHFVVVYRDDGNSDYGTAIIGTISGSTISYGSEYVFNAGESEYTSVATLDSTHFVVTYQDIGNSYRGTAIIGTVSGTTITYGSEYVFNAGNSCGYISVATLDSTHFVVAYHDATNLGYGTAIIGTVSGTTITYGSEYVFNAGNSYYISVATLDSTHFVVAYRDDSNSYYGTAIIGTVSGTAITYGSEYVFNAGNSYNSVASLDSTHFVVTYEDVSNSGYGTAIIGTVSGTAITYGSEYVFNAGSSRYTSVATLDSTHFVVAYRDGSNSGYGTAIIGTVSGTAITYGSEYVFNAGNSYDTSVAILEATLDSTHFVVAYRDDSNLYRGTAIIGTVSPPSNFFLFFN